MMRRFADVEYSGMVYRAAELIDGVWYFDAGMGNFQPFTLQERVLVLDGNNGRFVARTISLALKVE